MLTMKLFQVHHLLIPVLPLVFTYKIESCGSGKPAIEYAVTLAQTAMVRPLRDVQLGLSSAHGYTAMYKSNAFKDYIHSVMTQILHLSNTHVTGRSPEPTFVCVKPNMEQEYDIGYEPLHRCADTGVASFWAKDTAFVFLCPSFTALAFQPVFTPGGPRDIYCPIVRNNVFLGQSNPLVRYQNYELVHQLVHLYLQGDGLTSETEPKEVMSWNGCVGLGWAPLLGSPSVRNPFSLVYYVACKRLTSGGDRRVCWCANKW